jgi:hypothetical protein
MRGLLTLWGNVHREIAISANFGGMPQNSVAPLGWI